MSWKDIEGRAAYLWIYDRFIETAPRDAIVVEVGVALGKSIAYLARQCIDRKRLDINIYAVDPWAGTARNGEQQASGPPTADGDYQLFLRTMTQHAPEELNRINVIRANSASASLHFGAVGWRPDLVVLDAGHSYDDVMGDLSAWAPLIKTGGAIGGDDWMIDFPGVELAVRNLLAPLIGGLEVRHDGGWGTWRVQL